MRGKRQEEKKPRWMKDVMSRETVLKRYLETVRDDYEIIILDCMPSLGMLTINANRNMSMIVIFYQ